MDLFLSGQATENVTVDVAEIEHLLRDHVNRNHPDLKLSDPDYERLAKALKSFREANIKMRSIERTSENATELRRALQVVADSSKEITKITGMAPGEFFMRGDTPVQFGNNRQG